MSEPGSRSRRETEPQDDIEIVEIVGLDEDAPAGSADGPGDVELVFDEEAGPDEIPVEIPQGVPRETFLRLQADFENYRKRAERERDENARYAAQDILARLLPVLDNLERALAAAPKGDVEFGLRAGVELIHRQLLEELKRDGLRPMTTVGGPFDPELHEAAATDRSGELPPNTVVEEIRRGYLLHGRVLRPALVKVSVDPSGAGASGQPGEEW